MSLQEEIVSIDTQTLLKMKEELHNQQKICESKINQITYELDKRINKRILSKIHDELLRQNIDGFDLLTEDEIYKMIDSFDKFNPHIKHHNLNLWIHMCRDIIEIKRGSNTFELTDLWVLQTISKFYIHYIYQNDQGVETVSNSEYKL